MKNKAKKKEKKYVEVDTRKLTFMVVSVLLSLYAFQIIMHLINDRNAVSSNTSYETTNGLEIIEVSKDTKEYYTDGKWSFAEAFEGLVTTKTTVGIVQEQIVETESSENTEDSEMLDVEEIPLTYTITSIKCNGNIHTVIETNKNEYLSQNARMDLRLVDNNLFLLIHAYDTNNVLQEFRGYVSSEYNSETSFCDMETLTIVHMLVETLSKTDNYEVVYNCRTKIQGVLLDDITVAFPDNGYACRLLVDVSTYKPKYIVSTVVSENNFIELSYDNMEIEHFNKDEVYGITAFQDLELVSLVDGNVGCKLSDEEMAVVLEAAVRTASYGDFKIIDIENLDTSELTTESEDTPNGELE